MANTSGKQYAVGMRQARFFELDSRGIIAATDEVVPYEGIQVPAVKALELTIPDVRRIAHVGDDRIQAQDILPRLEPSSGVLRVGRNDHDLYALITGTKQYYVGERSGIGYATDRQGSEINVGLMSWQQSLDSVAKTRRYRTYQFPVILGIPVPGTMDENPAEFTFNLIPQVATKSLSSVPYTELTNGFTETEFEEHMAVGFPNIAAWLGDNIVTYFDFDAARPANDVNKVQVVIVAAAAQYGTVDATATVTTTRVTPTTKPGVGDVVIAYYEYTP